MTQNQETQHSLPAGIGIILVDHGSRREEANDVLLHVARRYAATAQTTLVEPAHMELAEPSIAQAFRRCVDRGARKIVVCLFFLSPGKHSSTDIPLLVAKAAEAFPNVEYTLTEPLGRHPRLVEILHDGVLDALKP